MHPKYISACRVCGSPHLVEIIDLGDQYLQGSFVKDGTTPPPRRRLPTKLVRCDVTARGDACGLVQLAHSFPPSVLYSNYWYRSGTNQTMRDHLQGIVKSTLAMRNDGKRGTPIKVLDIGCNDGTLLSFYPPETQLYGVDPSDIADSIAIPMTLVNTLFPSERARAMLAGIEFDIITSIAMFYDLESPVDFAREIAAHLAPNGVWVLEMSYLPLMLLQNSFDTICHEHLEYYSLAVLENIFRQAGMRVIRADINEINGGSIRCYVCRESADLHGTDEDERFLQFLRLREFEMALDTPPPYAAFCQRISDLRDDTRALLKALLRQGKRIHIYGASTKGNVLLQWYGLDGSMIEAAAERNPHKVGGSTLGTDIPMISEEDSRRSAPDYYLVLPWHFKAEFLERERQAIENGACFIFPLPILEMVAASNLDEVLHQLRGASSGAKAMIDLIDLGRR